VRVKCKLPSPTLFSCGKPEASGVHHRRGTCSKVQTAANGASDDYKFSLIHTSGVMTSLIKSSIAPRMMMMIYYGVRNK